MCSQIQIGWVKFGRATTVQRLCANLRFMAFEITLDVNDPEKMIKFWSTVLNYELRDEARYHDPNRRYWSIADPNNNGPRIIIQRVPEPVTAKTRFHIDIYSDDLDADADRAIALVQNASIVNR